MQQMNAGQPRGQQSHSVHSEEVIPQDPGHWYHRLQGARGQGESPAGTTRELGFTRILSFNS
eukprot:3362292-Prorocentrum_lima.AAC.1